VQDWLLLRPAAPQHSAAHTTDALQSAAQPQTVPPGISLVLVRHDAAGFSGAWLLQSVVVQHLKTGDWWQFGNRGGWIKGSNQAKAVTARAAAAAAVAATDASGSSSGGPVSAAAGSDGGGVGSMQGTSSTAGRGADEGTAGSTGPRVSKVRQLHLTASGIAANCPLPPMPCSSSSSTDRSAPLLQATAVQQQQGLSDTAGAAASTTAAAPADPATSQSAAPAGINCDVSAVGKEDSSLPYPAAASVPLDDVELKLRGSPRKGASSSRSRSPSPTHRGAQQQQQQLTPSLATRPGDAATASHAPTSGAAAAGGAAGLLREGGSLRSIAAMVSRAAQPAAAATAAAWDALGSRRSSAGELRGQQQGRRGSGSIAPAKMVPLVVTRGSSSSGGDGSEEGSQPAATAASLAAAGTAAAGDGLTCRVSRTLTHSSDGTPCRLVRCSSSYLGRTSSSGARQQQEAGERGVHFLEWAEQVEFDAAAMQSRRGGAAAGSSSSSGSSSVQSFTEEQLLEAQGGWEFVRPPESTSSYTTLIDPTPSAAAAAVSAAATGPGMGPVSRTLQPPEATRGGLYSSSAGPSAGDLQEVPLVSSKPVSLMNKAGGGGAQYQLRIHTADKMGAALPAGQHVCVEVLGSTGILLTSQLPRWVRPSKWILSMCMMCIFSQYQALRLCGWTGVRCR
jgi:hypothetical protein